MIGATHLAAGVCVGLSVSICLQLPVADTVAVTAVSSVASLVPDLDICTSRLGRLVAPASFAIQLLFGHRTILHSPLLYAIVLYGLYITGFIPLMYIVAAGIGVLSHLLLDMLNPSGIPLLWPFHKRFHLAGFHTGGLADHLLCVCLTIFAFLLVLVCANVIQLPIHTT